jgi:hypothetical protein
VDVDQLWRATPHALTRNTVRGWIFREIRRAARQAAAVQPELQALEVSAAWTANAAMVQQRAPVVQVQLQAREVSEALTP